MHIIYCEHSDDSINDQYFIQEEEEDHTLRSLFTSIRFFTGNYQKKDKNKTKIMGNVV